MDILKYKGYEGSTKIDMERGVCRGKILFIMSGDRHQYRTGKTRTHETHRQKNIREYDGAENRLVK